MRVLVFLQGTVIMHRAGEGCSREERVRQVEEGNATVSDYDSYIPVSNAVGKLNGWASQGVSILYLSSHQGTSDVAKDQEVLARHGFPEGQVYYRENGLDYWAVAQQVAPDILIEDDCESIGGEKEMTYPNLDECFRNHIKSIVVKEFSGIDHLPDDIDVLLGFEGEV